MWLSSRFPSGRSPEVGAWAPGLRWRRGQDAWLSPNISSRLMKTHLAPGLVPSAVPCRVVGGDLLHGQLGHRRLRLPWRKCFQLLSA